MARAAEAYGDKSDWIYNGAISERHTPAYTANLMATGRGGWAQCPLS